jgi:N-acetylglucosamine kinase-like BadF-type ATPase
VGVEVAGTNLIRALEQALEPSEISSELKLRLDSRIPLGLGIAGIGAGESGREAAEAFRSLLSSRYPNLVPLFFTDLEAAFAGTFEGEAGILVIGGTGSSGLGFDGKSKLVRVGGFGKRLGDPGSGFSVLLEAAQLLLSRNEGLLPGGLPSWGRAFLHGLGCRDPRDLIPIFARDPSPKELEQGIRVLEDTASGGEEEPKNLLKKAGRILADHAGALGVHLALHKISVSCSGGFLCKSPLVRQAFCDRLQTLSKEQGTLFDFSDRTPDPERGAAGLAAQEWPALQEAISLF